MGIHGYVKDDAGEGGMIRDEALSWEDGVEREGGNVLV
jgi:hypothetical protein